MVSASHALLSLAETQRRCRLVRELALASAPAIPALLRGKENPAALLQAGPVLRCQSSG
jgi:hypothetical protein